MIVLFGLIMVVALAVVVAGVIAFSIHHEVRKL